MCGVGSTAVVDDWGWKQARLADDWGWKQGELPHTLGVLVHLGRLMLNNNNLKVPATLHMGSEGFFSGPFFLRVGAHTKN